MVLPKWDSTGKLVRSDYPKVLVIQDTNGTDKDSAYDVVIFKLANIARTFTLPAVDLLNLCKRYMVMFQSTGTGTATVVPTGSDTIRGQSSLVLTVGDLVYLESDSVGNWAVLGPANAGVTTPVTAGTASAIGGVAIVGTPADAAKPVAPVLEVDGFIPESALDLVVIAQALRVATAILRGAVFLVGVPASAATPVVPTVEADGFIPESVLDLAVIGPALPEATTAAHGVVILGAPGAPNATNVTAVPLPINSAQVDAAFLPQASTGGDLGVVGLLGADNASGLVPGIPTAGLGGLFTGTLTTASLVGKTVTIANGLIVSIA